MRIMTTLAVFFYTTMLFFIGASLIAFAIGWFNVQDIYKVVEYAQLTINSRIITGLIGFTLI